MCRDRSGRYYVGHKGKFGHEFLEFEFRPDGLSMMTHTSLARSLTLLTRSTTLPFSLAHGGVVLVVPVGCAC